MTRDGGYFHHDDRRGGGGDPYDRRDDYYGNRYNRDDRYTYLTVPIPLCANTGVQFADDLVAIC